MMRHNSHQWSVDNQDLWAVRRYWTRFRNRVEIYNKKCESTLNLGTIKCSTIRELVTVHQKYLLDVFGVQMMFSNPPKMYKFLKLY